MTAKLDISFHIENPAWKVKLRPYTKTIQNVLDTSLSFYDKRGDFEIAVVLADDKFVQELNKQYRGKNKPTNVLSFPASLDDGELGDIILAFETVEKEAIEQNKSFRNHAVHLLVHGFLHLLGYDHIEDKQAEIMEKMEIKILKKLGICNPYL